MKKIIFIALTFMIASNCFAQTDGLVLQPYHKNVIKWNLTPMVWSTKNIMLSYERILTDHPNQSISFSLGYFELPTLLPSNIGGIISLHNRTKNGFNMSAEYRFYLSKQNRNPAPNGIYLAPFLWYWQYHFSEPFIIEHTSTSGDVAGTIQSLNAGLVLGYQFVFGKRFTLDLLLLGPTTAIYGHKLKVQVDVDEEERQNINQTVEQQVKTRFPIINLFVNGGEMTKVGTGDSFSFGFKYGIQLGYHF